MLRGARLRTSGGVNRPTIDSARRAAKVERAKRRAGDLFLYRRAFAECAERIQELPDQPERMLVVTLPGLEWTAEVSGLHDLPVRALDRLVPECADLIVAVGVIDHADDPALASFILAHALAPGGRLIGAALGSASLERMRTAVIDAERMEGRAVQRFHPLPSPSGLADLLASAGLKDVVVDADRVDAGYSGLGQLLSDLRDMGGTSSLIAASLSRRAAHAVAQGFLAGGERARETFEILHFSAHSANAV